MYTVTFLYGDRISIADSVSGRSAIFAPGYNKTITGIRNDRGQCVLMNATEARRLLGLKRGEPGDVWEFEDVGGLLDEITALDIVHDMEKAYYYVSVPTGVLKKVVNFGK